MMQPAPSTLILTKLQLPAPRTRAVDRARLLDKIHPAPDVDLLLVCAPAGYGKTTLLAQWAAGLKPRGIQPVWLALDETDNTPGSFATYLLTGLEQHLGAGSGITPLLQALRSSPEMDLQLLLPAIINAILVHGAELVLIFDDYHLIREPAIHRFVVSLINHRPGNLHLAMGSRANPPFSLARLRAKGRLREIRTADLRFTRDETAAFIRESMGVNLSPGLPEQLTEQVEGWAAGLQLAALTLAGQPQPQNPLTAFGAGHRRLAEYLLEEVINRLPDELQSFLLYTSILERISAPLCDAILGVANSAEMIGRLEQANLFLTALDSEGNWFRYHHLFRDFLRGWLQKTQPERAASLHREAADWFAGKGLLQEGFHHALHCGDWSFTADYVERNSFTLIIRSEIAAIYDWCAVFPETVMQNRPKLCVFQALALAYRFHAPNRSRIQARLDQAEKALKRVLNPDDVDEVTTLDTVVRTFMAMIPDPHADANLPLELARKHLAELPEEDPGRFPWLLITGYCLLALHRVDEAGQALNQSIPCTVNAGLFFGMVEATFYLARLAHSRGQLDEGVSRCRDTQQMLIALLQGMDLPAALGSLKVVIGDVLLERGQLEDARQHLLQGMEQMGLGIHPVYLMTGLLAQYRLYTALGDTHSALASLDTLDMLWPDISFLTGGLRCETALRAEPGDSSIHAAENWLKDYAAENQPRAVVGLGPVGAAEVYYQANLVWSRMQIELADPALALPWITAQLEQEQAQNITGREIELTLLAAQAEYQMGDQEKSLETFDRALLLAKKCGYLRTFDSGPVLDEIIHTRAKSTNPDPYLDKILIIIRDARSRQISPPGSLLEPVRAYPLTGESDPLLVEPLSERELDVLRMIASGATNQQIASRLVITIGTVKSHINHLLAKLQAGNRTEAVARARRFGLLE